MKRGFVEHFLFSNSQLLSPRNYRKSEPTKTNNKKPWLASIYLNVILFIFQPKILDL